MFLSVLNMIIQQKMQIKTTLISSYFIQNGYHWVTKLQQMLMRMQRKRDPYPLWWQINW